MERKSFELYVQTSMWIGGVAAAATGGALLAIVSSETPTWLIQSLRWLAIILLAALVSAVYMQLHAIRRLNELENNSHAGGVAAAPANQAAPATVATAAISTGAAGRKKPSFLQIFQHVLCLTMLVASVVLGVGLYRYQPAVETPPVAHWTVSSLGAAGGDTIIVMSNPDNSSVRVLTRHANDSRWLVEEVDPIRLNGPPAAAPVQPLPVGSATSPKP